MTKYKTILIDPPWNQKNMAKWDRRPNRKESLPYPTLSIESIQNINLLDLADTNCHLWVWTTNQFLPDTFSLIKNWGFKYLSTITWVKPSGVGAWFVNRSQHLIFAYKDKLVMNKRFMPTIYNAVPKKHSEKPLLFYDLIEKVSFPSRLEIFAREKRFGWDVFGNEVNSDLDIQIN